MSDHSESPTPRREFLGQMAASAIVLAGTACAMPATAAQGTTGPTPTSGDTTGQATQWDDSWFRRLTAKHKAVFDSPEIIDGFIAGPGYATRYLNGMRDAIGAGSGEAQVVLVIRHQAIPFAFNDAIWEKYGLGELAKVKSGDAWATRNPLAEARQSSTRPNTNAAADRPQANLAWFAAHGHILLGCDVATQAYSSRIARERKGEQKAVYAELKANLVTGMILQPNGIYAAHRAQEAGCTYIHAA